MSIDSFQRDLSDSFKAEVTLREEKRVRIYDVYPGEGVMNTDYLSKYDDIYGIRSL